MNVLIIINSFRLGGAEKLCYDLANRMSDKEGVKVYLYSLGRVETKLEKEMYSKFDGTKVKVGTFNKPYKKERIKTIFRIKKFCKKNKIDIVHTNGQSIDFLVRCTKFIGNKTKVVVTIHSTTGYSKNHEAFLCRFTDAYTAVSKDALRYAKENLKIKKTIHLIDNGIDLQKYSDITKTKKHFEILTVGRLESQKDYLGAVKFLAPFLRKHNDVKWVIYGDYSADLEYFNLVKAECAKLGVLDFIEFKGVVTDSSEIYSHGEVFVLASTYEGFGIAFIEAIMSNYYIFSRNVGVIQDIRKFGGVVYDIEEPQSCESLEEIYCNMKSKDILEKNKKIVESRYSINSMIEKYLTIYNAVIE